MWNMSCVMCMYDMSCVMCNANYGMWKLYDLVFLVVNCVPVSASYSQMQIDLFFSFPSLSSSYQTYSAMSKHSTRCRKEWLTEGRRSGRRHARTLQTGPQFHDVYNVISFLDIWPNAGQVASVHEYAKIHFALDDMILGWRRRADCVCSAESLCRVRCTALNPPRAFAYVVPSRNNKTPV